jgi:hypothetical protein
MNCHYCGNGRIGHVPGCPGGATLEESDRAIQIWRLGWDCGRSGKKFPEEASPTYRLGHHRGEVALEEAQNGHDIVHG